MVNNRKLNTNETYNRLIRKGDQQSELGCLALADNDKKLLTNTLRKPESIGEKQHCTKNRSQPTRKGASNG